jgi:hypothetical protein
VSDVQEFQSLSQADQTAILRKNLPLVHRLRQAICLASHNLSWRWVCNSSSRLSLNAVRI